MRLHKQRLLLNKRLLSEANLSNNIFKERTTILSNCIQITRQSEQKWIAVSMTSLTTTSLKKWRLEDVFIYVPMLNLLSTRGPEVSFHSVLLRKNLKFSLDLNWILSDFHEQFGRIDHRTPWQVNRRRPTILTLSGGGHTFLVTRHPGGGL